MKTRIGAHFALGAGVVILLSGIAHSTLGLHELKQSIAQGEISPRLAGPQVVDWVFSGVAMMLLGVLVAGLSLELRKGRRSAWRQGVLIGMVYVVFGLWAYWYRSGNPHFLAFVLLGALLCAPLLLTARKYSED